MPTAILEKQRKGNSSEPVWYLCPDCLGLGWVASNQRYRRLQGVRILRHIPCPTCQGALMLKTVETERNGVLLRPVKRCNQCLNWYAVGGGHKAGEPCPHNHAAKSHCHWHDLSVYPPPDVAGRRVTETEHIQWEEPGQTE